MNNKNKISMEYEARVFINEQKYELIKRQYLNLGDICRVFVNKNTYFDTADLYLTNHHIVLRIREIDDSKKELTLKIKGEKKIAFMHISRITKIDPPYWKSLEEDMEECGFGGNA